MDNLELDKLEKRGWGIRPSEQATVAGLIILASAAIAASWIYRGGLRDRMIDIDEAAPISVTFQLDINQADWPEWTLLPGVGEILAKRIVKDRDERGVFRNHSELERVSGIGPRTLDRMRSYLLPMPIAETIRHSDDDVESS